MPAFGSDLKQEALAKLEFRKQAFLKEMTQPVTQRPRARLDLLEQFVNFGEQADVELAEWYFAAVHETCLQLVKHPQTGSLYDSGFNGSMACGGFR